MKSVLSQLPAQFGDMVDDIQEGVFIVDKDRRVRLFNRACERLTGFRGQELLGVQWPDRDVADRGEEYGGSLMGRLCPGPALFRGELPGARERTRITRRDGSQMWVETTYTPLTEADGGVSCVLGVVRDLSGIERMADRLCEQTSDLRGQVEARRGEIQQRYGFSTTVSQSPKMEAVFAKITAAGSSSEPVLVSGEAGTGKELVARTIHDLGLQMNGPFVAVSCSAVSAERMEGELFGYVRGAVPGVQIDYDGLFRAAEGGTVFLEEITAMPVSLQAKLRRALDDKRVRPVGGTRLVPVTTRVIAATTLDPADAVADGLLRKDLFYRLRVISIDLPPLRERKEDVPLLVEHFLSRCSRQGPRQVRSVAEDVWPLLLRYDWGGNVGELRSAVESAYAVGRGPELRAADLPELIRGEAVEIRGGAHEMDRPLDEVLASVERQAILAALRRAGGRRSRAAQTIAISRSRLYRRMEALGIKPREDL